MIGPNKEFDLDEVLPGMTLQDDMPDAHGGVLLSCGTSMIEVNLFLPQLTRA